MLTLYNGNGKKTVYNTTERKAKAPWKNIIHRGHFDGYPENTIASFYKCWEAGMDGVEFDTQVTTDNVIICVHDATISGVSATTGKTVTITPQECTLAQVKDVVLASTDDFGDIYIPTLDEALTFFRYHDMLCVHDNKNKGSMEESAFWEQMATQIVLHNMGGMINYRCYGYEETVKAIDPTGGFVIQLISSGTTENTKFLTAKAVGKNTYAYGGPDFSAVLPFYPDMIEFQSVEAAIEQTTAYIESLRFFDNALNK